KNNTQINERRWHVWVPKVEIFASPSESSFIFGDKEFYVSGESTHFISEDNVDSPITPVTLTISSENVRLVKREKNLQLGNLNSIIDTSNSRLVFREGTLRHLGQEIEIGGVIDTKNDLFDLN